MSSQSRLPAPGTVFAGFLLEAEIGRGGAGAVFRVRSQEGKHFALKVLLRDLTDDLQLARFEREALAGQELRHPGVIAVYGAGVEQGLGFMVMELLTGALPLDEYVAAHSLDLPSRVRLLSEIALAVHAAHGAGLIHRDLKPDNVLVTPDGRPKVVDFGLARHVERERLTQSGSTMGTIHYMAPEQIRGQTAHADARTDVYALGVMLYQLLTGKLPFTGDTAIEIMRAALEFEPPPLPPEVSGMEPVVRLALAKEPDQRYATAEDFARDLQATESSQGTSASGILAARKRQRTTLLFMVLLPPAIGVVALLVFLFAPRDAGEGLEGSLGELRGSSAPILSSAAEIEGLPQLAPGVPHALEIQHWKALLSVARGEQASEAPVGEGPLALALAGARGGEGAAEALTRAIRGGVGRADLYRWRALALARPGNLSRVDARRLAADAEAWQGGARVLSADLDGALAEALARARIAQGDLEGAALLAGRLNSSSTELRWELGLARAEVEVLRTPTLAWEALRERVAEAPPGPLSERVEALAKRALSELRGRIGDGVSVAEELEVRALLLLWRRLDPAGAVPPEVVESLLHEVNGLQGPVLLELALALGEVFPDNLVVQRDLGATAGRLRKVEQRRLFPAMRRAIELEAPGDERTKLELTLAYLLAHATQMEPAEVKEFDGLVARVLPAVNDGELKAVLLSARGRQHVVRKNYKEAEEDLRAAVEFDPSFAVARFMLARLLQDTDRVSLALKEYLVYMRGNERNDGRRQDTLRYAWTHRSLAAGVAVIEAYLKKDPDHGGWLIRLAWLSFETKTPAELRALCSRAEVLLTDSEVKTWIAIAEGASEVVGLLARPEGREQARHKLKQLVDRLERIRGRESFP